MRNAVALKNRLSLIRNATIKVRTNIYTITKITKMKNRLRKEASFD